MKKPTLAVLLLTAIFVALQVRGSGAQSQDPHLPEPRSVPSVDGFVRIDDMLFAAQNHDLLKPSLNHKLAHLYYSGFRFGLWDFGVIPYELAPTFSEAERQRILAAMQVWSQVAPIVWVSRTTQDGFLEIMREDAVSSGGSLCFSAVGQPGRGKPSRLNLGGTCASSSSTISHELGHALGMEHEHARPDRDNFVTIDVSNVEPISRQFFAVIKTSISSSAGPYDLGSVMHYSAFAGALDRSRPTIVPHDPSWLKLIGQGLDPSAGDHNAVAGLYNQLLRESNLKSPNSAPALRFERGEMLLAMERLHAFYMSRFGLHRPQGLSINGRPDFLGIAQWIFDIYLPARSAGFNDEGAFDIVVASITRSDEWRQKNPSRTPLTPAAFRASVSFSRDEFIDVLNRLDRFYSAPEGLQRPNGLSIAGGPDFRGIATWVFDIYLAERLNGISPNGAWTVTENAIRATNEWRSKH